MNIFIIIVSVSLNAAAQIFLKKGMLEIGRLSLTSISYSQLIALMSNVYLWMTLLCYAVSVILWIVVLSRVEVSYAYSFLSIGYILVALAGYYLFGESLSAMKIWGIITICIGIYLISRS
ncbi:MAG TPA: 4-amino-4-deoxy-L-arabinose transferase [Candidatus Gallibacteroides avistercoris]|uniref:4-amino-4-deoxy-L-arabinose transferase n=1 Tax=Candidatus Gallibacteroides avistercoris TaxID=2840833 RepID=A0A9D1M970_9BACT|nr:4-amino-4-deoxy-L-arabinose transferase [Candidatus Gallibacteroides avistercoris]